MNTPILLTLFRISAIPVIMIVYYLPVAWAHPATAIIFAIAALTDWLDGYLARTLNMTTKLGEFLDPVADKLLVAVALVIILSKYHMAYLALPSAIIIGREIVISALREWMAEIGKRTSMAVTFIAKLKTTLQLIAVVLLLWWSPASYTWIVVLGSILLYIAAFMTLWSMFVYLKLAWPDLMGSGQSID